MASEDAMRKILETSANLASNAEGDNRDTMRRHCKSSFPFLNWRHLNDTFHADAFFLSVRVAQNHTCRQTHAGEKSGYWEACPIKKETHAVTSLQDFAQAISIPNTIKRDNSRTQTSENRRK